MSDKNYTGEDLNNFFDRLFEPQPEPDLDVIKYPIHALLMTPEEYKTAYQKQLNKRTAADHQAQTLEWNSQPQEQKTQTQGGNSQPQDLGTESQAGNQPPIPNPKQTGNTFGLPEQMKIITLPTWSNYDPAQGFPATVPGIWDTYIKPGLSSDNDDHTQLMNGKQAGKSADEERQYEDIPSSLSVEKSFKLQCHEGYQNYDKGKEVDPIAGLIDWLDDPSVKEGSIEYIARPALVMIIGLALAAATKQPATVPLTAATTRVLVGRAIQQAFVGASGYVAGNHSTDLLKQAVIEEFNTSGERVIQHIREGIMVGLVTPIGEGAAQVLINRLNFGSRLGAGWVIGRKVMEKGTPAMFKHGAKISVRQDGSIEDHGCDTNR